MSSASLVSGAESDRYDALLVVSFGGPERLEDVQPFLENVTRGKNIPPERLLEVEKHYELFDGRSPLNDQLRAMLTNLLAELNAHGPRMAVYWGNRFWHPLLTDVVAQMAEDGISRALAFVTSAFGSYPGCRAYLEDIELARKNVGPSAPHIDKLRLFYNHPQFIAAWAERTVAALRELPPEESQPARVVFTAHSLPISLARSSPYERQLRESCRLVWERVLQTAQTVNFPDVSACRDDIHAFVTGWDLAYQSRSGPRDQAWLEPDVAECLRRLHAEGVGNVVIVPIGFLVESMEIVYDLDIAVSRICESMGLNMVRAATIGTHPRLTKLIRALALERLDPTAERSALGQDGPWPDCCPADCCLTTNKAE